MRHGFKQVSPTGHCIAFYLIRLYWGFAPKEVEGLDMLKGERKQSDKRKGSEKGLRGSWIKGKRTDAS